MVIRTWPVLLGLLLLIVLAPACKKKRDIFAEPYVKALGTLSSDAFGLVITTSMEGYIEPCGCTKDPLGGIARFATVFNDVKIALKNNIALIDAGNLLFDAPTRIAADLCQDEKKIEVLLKTLSSLGLKDTVTGPLDNARGGEFLEHTYKKYHITPLKPLAIKTIKTPAAEIGIIAIDAMTPKDLQSLLPALRQKSSIKVLVALSELPIAQTKELLHDCKDVDIVVQGQTIAVEPHAPAQLGDHGPWLIEGGRQGQLFSMLVFQHLDKRTDKSLLLDDRLVKRASREALLKTRAAGLKQQAEKAPPERKEFLQTMINRAHYEIGTLQKESLPELRDANFMLYQIHITRKIEPEEKVKKRVADYDKSIPQLVKKCEAGLECPKAGPNEARFVGVEVCKGCHQEAYTVWKDSIFTAAGTDEHGNEIERRVGHSKAWQTLVDVKKDTDRTCIGCHSIGFMQKGGYCRASEVDFRKNVQCESCHGAGSLHAQSGDKQFIKRKVSESTCRECHQVPHIPSYESFNYDESVVKILGKGHGERLLKELTHNADKS